MSLTRSSRVRTATFIFGKPMIASYMMVPDERFNANCTPVSKAFRSVCCVALCSHGIARYMIFGAHRGGANGNDAFDVVGGVGAGAPNSSTRGGRYPGTGAGTVR